MRPQFKNAWVFVVPLRAGGGTRLKILEAMAMERPVVSTTIGAEGIPCQDGRHILLADSPIDFANAVLRLIADERLRAQLAREAASWARQNYKIGKACPDGCSEKPWIKCLRSNVILRRNLEHERDNARTEPCVQACCVCTERRGRRRRSYRRMPQLDGLRALAVAGVLWSHAMPVAYISIFKSHVGHLGVQLFFVLSGFLISGILLDISKRANSSQGKTAWIEAVLHPALSAHLPTLLYGAVSGCAV